MPVKSAKQYGFMQAASHGKIKGLAPEKAEEFIHKTSSNKRKAFTKAVMNRAQKNKKFRP